MVPGPLRIRPAENLFPFRKRKTCHTLIVMGPKTRTDAGAWLSDPSKSKQDALILETWHQDQVAGYAAFTDGR